MIGRFYVCLRAGLVKATFAGVGMLLLGGVSGCSDLFNPSFLRVVDPSGGGDSAAFSGVDGPTGHLPILFQNNARMADNVFRFVIQADAVVRPEVVDELLRENPQLSREEVEDILQKIIDDDPVDLEGLNVPPRVRLTVSVVNVDGGVQTLEFLDGLRIVRQEGGGPLPQDLRQNTNDTFIVQCEISQITVERIDVFVPVELQITRNIFNQDGFIIGEECFTSVPPQFDDLEPDENFDSGQGEFELKRNFDPRFFPPPLTTLQCGAVLIIELTGELFLPFRDVPCEPAVNPPADGLVPAFLNVDPISANLIPGFYGVKVTVRN